MSIPPGADLSTIPMGMNPDGSPPNFSDSAPSLANAVIASGSVFAALATIAVAVRLGVYYRVAGKFHVDDYLSLFALITSHAYMAIIFSNHLPASLRHTWDVPLSIIDEAYVKKITALGFIAGPSVWASRAAILVLQLRVFKPKRWFRITTYVSLGFLTLTNWSNVPVYAALCVPHNSSEGWDFVLLEKCFPASYLTVVTGAIGVAFDLYMLILPQPLIFRLHLSMAKKIGLALTFAAGLFATIASCISLYYRVILLEGLDVTWNSGNVFICVFVETYIIIIVGCVPAFASFWKNTLLPSSFFTSVRSLLGSRATTTGSSRPSQSGGHSKPARAGYERNPHNTISNSAINKTVQYSVEQESRSSDEVELTGVKAAQRQAF